jgi:DnaJ-domain-containing protein 1
VAFSPLILILLLNLHSFGSWAAHNFDSQDPWKVFDLPPGSPPSEIEKRYRKLMMKFDARTPNTDEEKSQNLDTLNKISAAMKKLGLLRINPSSRASYHSLAAPWTILGIPPGSPRARVERQYRKLSMKNDPRLATNEDDAIAKQEKRKMLSWAFAQVAVFSPRGTTVLAPLSLSSEGKLKAEHQLAQYGLPHNSITEGLYLAFNPSGENDLEAGQANFISYTWRRIQNDDQFKEISLLVKSLHAYFTLNGFGVAEQEALDSLLFMSEKTFITGSFAHKRWLVAHGIVYGLTLKKELASKADILSSAEKLFATLNLLKTWPSEDSDLIEALSQSPERFNNDFAYRVLSGEKEKATRGTSLLSYFFNCVGPFRF